MGLNNFSDYGSGSSTSSTSSWMGMHKWPSHRPAKEADTLDPKSSSYLNLVMGRCTLEDMMKEFRMNGSDSPYNPDEDKVWNGQAAGELTGMGPAGQYLRQKSWPAPERSPAPCLPRPRSEYIPAATSTPVFDVPDAPLPPFVPEAPKDRITAEQTRVLNSLPDSVLYSVLRELHSERRSKLPQECRFCKNNGERESYYRTHTLKDASGRVTCPVLRAFVCKRCGASGDFAHTIKYCPLSSNEERIKSAAMMRSVRMASGRYRRHSLAPSITSISDYMVFGETTPSVVQDNTVFQKYGEVPLDPLWAALEQKLML